LPFGQAGGREGVGGEEEEKEEGEVAGGRDRGPPVDGGAAVFLPH